MANSFAKTLEAKTGGSKLTAKATSQTLILANEARIEFGVFNPSSKEVWLTFGETAEKEKGVWLKKEVGAYVNTSYNGIVTVITTEGEGTVTFYEV